MRSRRKYYGVYGAGFEGYLTMTAYIYPTASLARLVATNVLFCMLYYIDDKFESSGSRAFTNYTGSLERVLLTGVRIMSENYHPK